MPPIDLALRRYGTGPQLLALHGFTLTGAQFAPYTGLLDRTILAPDLPGHGGSASAGLQVTIAALADLMDEQPLPVLGYSLGGRIGLALALQRPDLVTHLVVVSAGAGIEDPSARARRVAEDDELADRIGRVGLDRFLDVWLSASVTSTAAVDETRRLADREVRQENSAEGLAAALREFGQGSFPYLGTRLDELRMPLLVVSGEADDRYVEQGAALAEAAPVGRHVVVPGAGHNVVLEAPEELARLVEEFVEDYSQR